MARIRLGPVRVGGGRKASFTAHAGPVGVTIGGGRKRRTRSQDGRTNRDSWESEETGLGEFDSHYWSVYWNVISGVESRFGADTGNPHSDQETFGSLFVVFMILGAFATLNLSHPTRTVCLSLAGLTFVQVMSSPGAQFIPLVGAKRGDALHGTTWAHVCGMWARARRFPIVTPLPFYLPVLIQFFVSMSGVFPAPNASLPAFGIYLIAMPLLTSRRVRGQGLSKADVRDAIIQNLRNACFLSFSRKSQARLALLRNRLRWIDGFTSAADQFTRSTDQIVRQHYQDERRFLLEDIEKAVDKSARTRQQLSQTRFKDRLTSRTGKSTTKSRRREPAEHVESQASKSSPPGSTPALDLSKTSYVDRLRMSARERGGRSASDT